MNRAASKQSVFLSLFVIQLWICQPARGQLLQQCARIDGCSCNYHGDVYQLKYLGDYIQKNSPKGYLTARYTPDEYYFNPCKPFKRPLSTGGDGCTDVLACQHHPDEYDIGSSSPSSPLFSIVGGELQLDYTARTLSPFPVSPRKSTVICKCDRSITLLPKFVAKGESPPYSAQYKFDLQHTCCCPGECNSGMPAGPVNGGPSKWSNWGSCSKSCNGGIQIRTRNCTSPKPSGGGKTCVQQGIKLKEQRSCNNETCGVDGGPSKWTNWGKCSEKCGGGVQSRQRSCSNPSPSGNGKTCLQQGFQMEENRKCDSQICPGMTVIIVSASVLVSVLIIVAAILYIFFGKRTSHSAIRMTAAKSILPNASDDGFKSQRPHVKVSDVGANNDFPYLEL